MGNKLVPHSESTTLSTAIDGGGEQPNPPAIVFSIIDNTLKEFKQHITVGEILTSNTTFITSSESMEVGCHLQHLANDEVLRPGNLYFLLPVSFSICPLSIHDLCNMAVKVAEALGIEKRCQRGGAKSSGNSMEVIRCYPILPDVTHLVDKVEKLRFRKSTCKK